MDLEAYLQRIGYQGIRSAELGVLADLIAHQAASIPFEAIDVLLGKGVDIAPSAIFDKLVTRRRGGYCFEQNGLLRQALDALGFAVEPRLARVLWMRPVDAPPLRATHMVLVARIGGRDYLADAGFGNGTPTAPLAFETEAAQPTPLETFRLIPTAGGHRLEMQVDGNWAPVYEILTGSVTNAGFEDANLFTSTSPDSRFRRDFMLARATPDARYLVLGNRLTTRPTAGAAEARVMNAAELAHSVETVFGLTVEPGWRALFERYASQRE